VGTLTAWHWDFGDGYTHAGQHPGHSYAQPGVFTVTLTVTNTDVASDTHTVARAVTVTKLADVTVITYTYDDLNRLTEATYSTGDHYVYTYDRVGNRTFYSDTVTTHDYTYNAANQLIAVDGDAYSYDQRGNLIAADGATYQYDGAGRLVQYHQNINLTEYTYNGDGLRVHQTVYADSVMPYANTFTWDWASGVPEVLSSTTGFGGDPVTTQYLVGHETLGWQEGNEWAYALPDALGSVRQEVDASGTVVDARAWSPYGVEFGGSPMGLGFTGEWQDVGSGLTYLRARWYDGSAGRFTSEDIWQGNIDQPGTLHPFVYVINNPLTYVDPSGEIPEVIYNRTLGYYTVKIDVQIYGPGATQAEADRFKKAVEEVWNNGNPEYDGHPVFFEVDAFYQVPDYPKIPIFSWYWKNGRWSPTGGEASNIVAFEEHSYVDYSLHPCVYPFEEYNRSFDWGKFWFPGMDRGVLVHEAGHLFGIYEDYYQENPYTGRKEPKPGYEDWLTAYPNPSTLDRPSQGEIDLIINSAKARGQITYVGEPLMKVTP